MANKPRKPTPNQAEFDRQAKKIGKPIKSTTEELKTPRPITPEKVHTPKKQPLTPSPITQERAPAPTTPSTHKRPHSPDTTTTRRIAKSDQQSITPRMHSEKAPGHLSPEELKRRRREAAKKAAASRRAHAENDPEFAAHMAEIHRLAGERLKQYASDESNAEKRRQAAKKAAQTRAQRMTKDPDYYEHMQEVFKASGERLKKWNENKRRECAEADNYLPEAFTVIMDEIVSILLSTSPNAEISDYLMAFLLDRISAEGEQAVAARLEAQHDRAIEMANHAAYDSDSKGTRNVYGSAIALAEIINGAPLDGKTKMEIEELAYEAYVNRVASYGNINSIQKALQNRWID